MTVDREVLDLLSDLFSGEHSSDDFDAALWTKLGDAGLSGVLADPDQGWPMAAAVIRAAARVAAPLPFVEHELLAAPLRAAAGLEQTPAASTAAVVDGSGRAHNVPWASQVERIVVLWEGPDGWLVADLPTSDLDIIEHRDVAGRSIARLSTRTLNGHTVDPRTALRHHLRGALGRAIQLSEALDVATEHAITHATQRRQFGKPIGSFQAVQALVVESATEASLARVAVDAAVAAAAASDDILDAELAIAVARSVGGHAASTVIRHTHQVLGAMGTTLEHPLQRSTRLALASRSDFGTVREWDARLAELAIAAPGRVWDLGLPS